MRKRNKTIAAVVTAVGAAAIWAGAAVIPSAMASEAPADQPGVEAPAQDLDGNGAATLTGSATLDEFAADASGTVTASATAISADESAALPAGAGMVTVSSDGGIDLHGSEGLVLVTDGVLVPISEAP